MLTEALLASITEAVFGYILEKTTLGDKVKGWLRLDPQRLAFQVALTKAFADFARKYPDWAKSLFDEHFLANRAASSLALCLQRDDMARPEDLAEVWADQLGQKGEARERQVVELRLVAADFLGSLENELRRRPEFRPLFDSRALDAISEATEQIAQTVEVLRAELNTGDVIFRAFAKASVPISRHIRLGEFQTLVKERTRRFVGREYIFKAIDDLVADPNFPSGYIVVRGEPGIGKTALVAQMVKQAGHVHHFNIATQNIRSARSFLANVCAQLIVRYQLEHLTLPPDAEKDSGVLSQLLAEVAEKRDGRPTAILVDAVDEAEDLGLAPGANILYLPSTLPKGIFFVVTTREKAEFRLFVDYRKDIYMGDDDPRNLEDVRQYIQNYVEEHRTEMAPQIKGWGVEEGEFVEVITEKSEGNFMYLVYVLRDIREGKLITSNVDDIRNLPKGLEAYYQRHWRAMRAQDEERFDKYQEPVVCILATVREPVTIAQVQEWTELKPTQIKRVIDEWREFLNVDEPVGGDTLYRIYHASFQDFLKEEVGLVKYHDRIAVTALRKIPGFFDGGVEG